jgi:hypothetical protein
MRPTCAGRGHAAVVEAARARDGDPLPVDHHGEYGVRVGAGLGVEGHAQEHRDRERGAVRQEIVGGAEHAGRRGCGGCDRERDHARERAGGYVEPSATVRGDQLTALGADRLADGGGSVGVGRRDHFG